ncbi:MAG: hypothetical protein KKB30_01985 [Proteobacteria bacterium]|nr:hypothetical protein [Pseudomonadota bacterium]MBU1716364.1 hypothetical protein [Pseudomonadota bacterium]
MKKIFSPLIFIFALLFLSAVQADAALENDHMPEEIQKSKRIAVLPVISHIEGKKKSGYPEEQEILNKVVADFFINHKSVVIVSESQKEALAADFAGDHAALAQNIGTKLDCDALLTIDLSRFRQREGGDYSSNTPASIAFEFRLIDLKNGSILCSGIFDETQQSLFENLWGFSKSISRGFKWITVEELAREGVIEKFSNCSYLVSENQ